MSRAVVIAGAYLYYLAAILFAAGAMPAYDDREAYRVTDVLPLIVISVLCIALGAAARMRSRGTRIPAWLLVPGIVVAFWAGFVGQWWLTVALLVPCIMAFSGRYVAAREQVP